MFDTLTYLSIPSLLGVFGGFTAGVLVVFSPSSLPLIPVVIGYLVGKKEERRYLHLFSFLAGIVTAGMLLGGAFALMSHLIGGLIGPVWNLGIAILLGVMGFRMLGVIRFKTPAFRPKHQEGDPSFLQAFFFGMPFVFAL